MKKIFLIIYSTIFIFNSSFGQGGTWTWISGDSYANSLGIFGTQGVPSVSNHPPGEYEAVDFKDHQGNFWLYGGTYPSMSDLWKFNPVTLEWTWVKGDGQQNDATVFGTIGISSPSNTPGQRTYCAATWVDTSGIFWLFGGSGASNDLWKYDISTNQWTWMKGDTLFGSAVYGTQGIPSSSNTPGESDEECSAWTDSSNNLWFLSYDVLWRFDISTLEWTWMKGYPSGSIANYGVKGVADSSNDPGSRSSYTKWKDINGNFWLMGGIGNGDLNDVWKYDLNINEWTWMSGPIVSDDPGSYQSNCIFNTVNWPSSRKEQRSSVTDYCGRFWLFGGISSNLGMFNDLWIFDPQQLAWNWLSGTNVPVNGNYGSLGVPALSNTPPSRCGADAWWGNDNKFYMYGGLLNDNFPVNCCSDLWVFNPDTSCVSFSSCGSVNITPPVANFQTTSTAFCSNTCINFSNLSTNATSYQWTFSGAIDSTSSDQNPQNICYSKPGIYNVTLIATNAGGSNTVTFSNYINVSPAPPTPVITQHNDTLYCSIDTSYKSYQWYLDSAIITGATDTLLIISQSGNYNLSVTNSSGCNIAVGITVILGLQNYMNDNTISLSPNPATDQLSITGSWKETGNTKLTVFNTLGQVIYTNQINRKQETINCKPFPAGIYFIQVANETGRWVGRFVKE